MCWKGIRPRGELPGAKGTADESTQQDVDEHGLINVDVRVARRSSLRVPEPPVELLRYPRVFRHLKHLVHYMLRYCGLVDEDPCRGIAWFVPPEEGGECCRGDERKYLNLDEREWKPLYETASAGY